MIEVKCAPNSVVEGGCPMLGSFNQSIENVNILDIKSMKPEFIRNRRLKEWEAFQLTNEHYFILGAIYNMKIATRNILVIYDRRLNKVHKFQETAFLKKAKLSKGLRNTTNEFKIKKFDFKINNNIEEGWVKIKIDIKDQVAIDVEFTSVNDPLVVVMPFSSKRILYSHKEIMKASGKMILAGKENIFGEGAIGIIDDHKGQYPYSMKYNWVTGCIMDQGKVQGFNLTKNQTINQEIYNENCLWMDGKVITLPPVEFELFKDKWLISDKVGLVNIKFILENSLEIKLKAGLVAVDYTAQFGLFEGVIAGQKIDGFFGMGEDKKYRM